MQRITIILTFLAMFSSQLLADPNCNLDRFKMIDDRANLVTELRIEATDGKVAMSDVFRAVSRLNGYEDAELRGRLPACQLSLEGRSCRWTIGACNRVLHPCIHITRDGNSLNISVDRESAQSWINNRKASVRKLWNKFDWRSETPEYGIRFLGKPVRSTDIVVLVHGLNSRPEDLMAFKPIVEQAGLSTATFRYPNDQPIGESARLLSSELRRLRELYPQRSVRLLTHSMGGLVARAAIETELDAGNVTQLIMIAPPNHGSALAKVGAFMDCYEFFTSSNHRRADLLVECVSDGLGEATADLVPRSVFLDRLNLRPRNPDVRYSILLGTDGPMDAAEMESLRETVRSYTDGTSLVRFMTSKLNRALTNLDEVVAGKGDGVVACRRGRLQGVSDVVELPFSHASILSPRSDGSRKAYSIVRQRLQL